MVEIRGWIMLECEKEDLDLPPPGKIIYRYENVYEKITEILAGHIACVNFVVQNAMVGISIFDFSNHLGKSVDKLLLLKEYIEGFDPDIQGYIIVTDSETEKNIEIEINNPRIYYGESE